MGDVIGASRRKQKPNALVRMMLILDGSARGTAGGAASCARRGAFLPESAES